MTTPLMPFTARLCLNLLTICLIGFLIYSGRSILLPLCFAIILAMLLLPVVNFLLRKGLPEIIALVVPILLAIIFVGAILYFLSAQFAGFMEDLPGIKEKLNQHITSLQQWINDQFNISSEQQQAAVDSAKENIKQSGSGNMGTMLIGLAGGLAMLILLPIYTLLILYYRKLIHRFLTDLFPRQDKVQVEEVLNESKTIVQGYMVGLLLEMAIVTALNVAGFLVIGIQHAIFLAVLAAVLNLIPYIGMLIASVLCMAVTLTTSDNAGDVLLTGAILIVVQFIDNNFIMPYIVSSKVRINALVSIIGVLVGGALAGISGMFLSIPVMAIMKAIFDRVEGLKPWGMLLGDDQTRLKPVKQKGKTKKG